MTVKTKETKATTTKKENPKKAVAAAPKVEKKAATKDTEEQIDDPIEETEGEREGEVPAVDLEELEEQAEEAAASASGQGGNAAAIAAASSSSEMSASFKNFRHHPDMENFYRFIYENDLRHEALAIIDEIMVEKQQRRLGTKGTKAH